MFDSTFFCDSFVGAANLELGLFKAEALTSSFFTPASLFEGVVIAVLLRSYLVEVRFYRVAKLVGGLKVMELFLSLAVTGSFSPTAAAVLMEGFLDDALVTESLGVGYSLGLSETRFLAMLVGEVL